MARPVRPRAERLAGIVLATLFSLGCGGRSTVDVTAVTVEPRSGRLLHHGRAYSGDVVDHSDLRFVQKASYKNGVRHGLAQAWYSDGSLAYMRRFSDGLRQGEHVGFWPGGVPQFRFRYVDDLFEGEQASYYKNGMPLELRHYHAGQEVGRQQIWAASGELSSNYIVKEGRRYGLVGSVDCVTVH